MSDNEQFNYVSIKCPNCDFDLIFDYDWLKTADLVYCGNCTKTFPIEMSNIDPSIFSEEEF